MSLKSIRNRLENEKGRHAQVVADLEAAEVRLSELQVHGGHVSEALDLIQRVAKATQDQMTWYISEKVSAAVRFVFPDHSFEFLLRFVTRRGSTEADILLVDADGNEIRPRDADGGGLVNVVAFALRVVLWSLTKPTRPSFWLDEPLHFLHSRDAHLRVSRLMKEVSDELGIQLVMVTGEETEEIISQADRVFEVKRGAVECLR